MLISLQRLNGTKWPFDVLLRNCLFTHWRQYLFCYGAGHP